MEIRIEVLTPEDAREIVAATGLGDYGHREKIDGYKQWMLDGKWSLRRRRRLAELPLLWRQVRIGLRRGHESGPGCDSRAS